MKSSAIAVDWTRISILILRVFIYAHDNAITHRLLKTEIVQFDAEGMPNQHLFHEITTRETPFRLI